MEIQFSSALLGNLTMNLEPALSSLSLRGRKRQTTLILSSAGISRSADMLLAVFLGMGWLLQFFGVFNKFHVVVYKWLLFFIYVPYSDSQNFVWVHLMILFSKFLFSSTLFCIIILFFFFYNHTLINCWAKLNKLNFISFIFLLILCFFAVSLLSAA